MGNGALRGLKVIDLSRVLGGPFCTQIPADRGAEVINKDATAVMKRWQRFPKPANDHSSAI